MAQVVTSIQDMTLSFVPRTVAVFLACLFLFPWLMNVMISFLSGSWDIWSALPIDPSRWHRREPGVTRFGARSDRAQGS